MRPQAPKCRRDYFGVDPVVLVEVLLFFFFAFFLLFLCISAAPRRDGRAAALAPRT